METSIPVPDTYGLCNDPLFREINFRLLEEKKRLLFVGGTNHVSAAVFNCGTMRIAGLALGHLLPLCGASEAVAPLTVMHRPGFCEDLAVTLRQTKGWSSARIPALREQTKEALAAALKKSSLPFRILPYSVRVVKHDTFEDYCAQKGKDFRRRMKKTITAAEEAGVTFVDQVPLSTWKRLYASRHHTLTELDYSVTPEFHRLLEICLSEYRHQQRCIEVGVHKDGQIIAAGFSMLFQGAVYFFQTAHDPAHDSLRPGALVFYKLLEHAFRRGFPFISFMADASYHQLYTHQVLSLFEIEAFSRSPAGMALYAYRSRKGARPLH